MFKQFKRWYYGKIAYLSYRLEMMDVCELCKEGIVDAPCVGCGRRICGSCDSLYYEDEYLCTECRKDITPEEEEEDRKLQTELDEPEKI
jgi:hypothetical protein